MIQSAVLMTFEIVLDDDDGVAGLDQFVQHFEEFCDVVEMQPGGGLVQNVERAAGGALAQLLGELHALGFAKLGQRRRVPELADMDVASRGRRGARAPAARAPAAPP